MPTMIRFYKYRILLIGGFVMFCVSIGMFLWWFNKQPCGDDFIDSTVLASLESTSILAFKKVRTGVSTAIFGLHVEVDGDGLRKLLDDGDLTRIESSDGFYTLKHGSMKHLMTNWNWETDGQKFPDFYVSQSTGAMLFVSLNRDEAILILLDE